MANIRSWTVIFQGLLLGLLFVHSGNANDLICVTNPNTLGCRDIRCPEWYPPPSQEVFECPRGAADDLYRNPRDCCTFYKCVSDHFYCYECPGNLVYNQRLKQCDFNFNVPGCEGVTWCASVTLLPSNNTTPLNTISTITPSTPTITTATPTATTRTTTRPKITVTRPGGGYFECPDNKPNGNFPITDGTCNVEFYQCLDGDAYLARCPEGVFDPNLLFCVLPGDSTTCGGLFTCPEFNSGNGFYPIPDKCVEQYYICVSRTAYNATCPNNAIFDPVLGYCLSASNPSLSCRPGVRSFFCPYSPGLFAYPESCSFYYDCSGINGLWSISQCPWGEVFNPDTESCEIDRGHITGCESINQADK